MSLAACRDCGQRKALCPAGSISHGSIPADVGWQHTASPWHGAGSALRPPGSRGMPGFCAAGPPAPLCVICPRGWLGLEEGHFPTVASQQCPPRGKPTVCRLNGDPVLRGLSAMHIPSVLECPNVCTSSGWDLAPQNASPGCETPWGQPLCLAPGMGSRLPGECCDAPTKPSCGPCLHPCGQTRVSSLLGGGLSPPHCCQTHECVPGHPGL